MKIGILEADKLSDDLQKEYGSYGNMFQKLLLSVDKELSLPRYQVTESVYPKNIDDCDAYLITGSKSSVYEKNPWIKQLQDYVVTLAECQKKLIGICFGHQIIAQALGGQVQKSGTGWSVGMTTSTVFQSKPWMDPAKERFLLLASHQDQVTTLPPQAQLIAGDEFCPYASYQVGEQILTFQGHPEFTHDYILRRMQDRREIIGEPRYQQGLASLDQSADHQLIAQWIINFVQQ